MAYYLRFLCENDRPLALKEILRGLQDADPGFELSGDGSLMHDQDLLAQVELTPAAYQLFAAEIAELRELAGQGGPASEAVARRLESVTAVFAVRVLWPDRTAEQTLELLSPLWEWLLANRRASSRPTARASTTAST
jgi:hypothetical protein